MNQIFNDREGSMKIPCATLAVLLFVASGLHAQTPPPATPPPAATLETVLLRPSPWTATPQDLLADLQNLQFRWLSAAQDSARSVRPNLTFANQPVSETVLRFADGKLASATLLYYDRASSKELHRAEFEKFVDDISQKLTTLTGQQPVDRGRDATSAVKAEGKIWQTESSKYLLEWSFTKESVVQSIPFRAEFVRLTVQPKVAAGQPIGAAVMGGPRSAVKQFVGRDHVVIDPSGDVKLKDIPMVDQGDKGYCVVASTERVMRYYGVQVDQQELAQIANSDATKGTSVEAMVESLKKLTSRLGVKVKPLYEGGNITEFLKMVEEYNRAAKRAKAPEIKLGGTVIDVSKIYREMKPEIYREVRLKKNADYGRFQREIQRNIDDGIPLLWSVHLGMVAEKGLSPQAFGGHMRLIIGYDTKSNEILYSDSWGAGHEEKRMSFDDAWILTDGLATIQPISS
ncbi:hypothetical protein BH09VER1_BH09VER1_02060 [soil metagenome]